MDHFYPPIVQTNEFIVLKSKFQSIHFGQTAPELDDPGYVPSFTYRFGHKNALDVKEVAYTHWLPAIGSEG